MEFDNLSVVLQNIPKVEAKQDTFFDILGVQTRETYISKVYNYFLNSENKEIANLFFTSLANLIKAKTQKEFFSDDFACETEVLTKKGGRIDLLITSNEEKLRKIIIENKVFHFLANDLRDYWESTDADEKIGVLLTLQPQKIETEFIGQFINITHQEWMNELKSTGLPINLKTQEYIYINDFYLNLDNLMENQKFSEGLKFFYNNAKQISEAVDLLNKFLVFIKSNINTVANEFDYEYQHKKDYYSYIYKNDDDKIFYSILYHQIMEGKSEITILIEFWTKEYTDRAKEIDDMLAKSGFNLNDYTRYGNNGGNVGGNWLHFISKDYKLELNDFDNLGEFISKKIKEDFKDIMKKVLDYTNTPKQQ